MRVHKFIILSLLISLWSIASGSVEVNSSSPLLVAMKQQLWAEQARNNLLAKKLKVLQQTYQAAVSTTPILRSTLSQIETALHVARAESVNIDLTFKTAQLEVELTQQAIRDLQRHGADILGQALRKRIPDHYQALQAQQTLLDLQQQRVRVLQKSQDFAQQAVTIIQTGYHQLQKQYQHLLQNQSQKVIHALATQLQDRQYIWLTQLDALNSQLQKQEGFGSLSQTLDASLTLQSIAKEEKSNLIHAQLNLETVSNQLETLSEALKGSTAPPLSVLTSLQKPLENLLRQFQWLEDLLKKKLDFLQNCLQIALSNQQVALPTQVQHQKTLATLKQLTSDYQKQLLKTTQLTHQTKSYLNHLTQQLHEQFANRQDLPGFDIWAWLILIEKMVEIPELIKLGLLGLSHLIKTKVSIAPWWQLVFAGGVGLGWIVCWVRLKHFLTAYWLKFQVATTTQSFIPTTLKTVFLQLLDRHALSSLLITSMSSVLWLAGVPFSAFSWILSLIAVMLVFSIILQAIHLLLLEGTVEQSGQDVTLYYRLKWTLIIGGIVTTLSLLAHKLGVNYELRALFGRLFMLFLLIIALVLLKSWKLLPQLLEDYLAKKPSYLKQIIRVISFLFPFSLLLNAIIGLIGYVQLAWAIAFYQGLLLLALIIYFILKGLLDELIRNLSEQSIRRLRNGWLWSEAFLKPLQQLLKLTMLVSTIVLLFGFFGWNDQWSTFSIDLDTLLHKKWLMIVGIPVTISVLIKIGISITILTWLTRWTREFAYRWLFAELKDLGLRNSLSLITQYTAIFIGIIITLYVAGVTLTLLQWAFGIFSFGIGFGLRDIFNNFVTGILLLLERPVKIGDWVTVGDYEGQVTHLGARSITVNTEDHQELMVPNNDLFTKHFVNWTRHDSIVRVIVPVAVNRRDDPFKVRELILDVITTIPKILNSPKPEVYFKETDRMLLEFKVEYYVDITQIISRAEVRSQFLFALWDRFRAENILPPDVPHALHIQGHLERLSDDTQSQ